MSISLEKVYREIKLLRRDVSALKKDSLDADIAAALDDAKHGRVKGPFRSGKEMMKALRS